MAGVTDTQSLRFGEVTDPLDWTMERNLADDIAAQLDLADVARTHALKRPEAYSQRNSALALPVSTVVLVPFNAEIWDTHDMVDIAGQPSRLTASATAGAGLYLVEVKATADTTGWTKADLLLNKNGSMVCQRTFHTPQGLSALFLSMIVPLSVVGDFMTASLYHEGGGTTNTSQVDFQAWKIADN